MAISTRQDSIKEMESFLQLVKSPTKLKKAEEAKVKKTPFYKKVISFLTTGETGQAAYDMLEGKNPITSYGGSVISSIAGKGYDKRTYADVLEKLGMKKNYLSKVMPFLYNETGKGWKFKRGGFLDPTDTGTLGLALDVLGDPTTYMGGIGIFKRIGRGLAGLTDEGIKLSDNIVGKVEKQIVENGLGGTEKSIKLLNEAGEDLAEALKRDPDKYFKGVTFAGKDFVKRKYISAIGRHAEYAMGHIPILNRVYEGAKYGVQDVFQLGADVLRKGKLNSGLAGEITAERYLKVKNSINKKIRYANDDIFSKLKGLREDYIKATNSADRAAVSAKILDTVELNLKDVGIEKIDDKLARNLVEEFNKFSEGLYGRDREAREKLGQEIYKQISGYMPHVLTKDAKKILAAKNVNISKLQSWKSWSTKSEKSRNLYRFVTDGGKEQFGTAQALGLKKFNREAEENAINASIDRATDAGRASDALQKRLDELPQLDEWYQDASGKIYIAERPMTINEINNLMQDTMDKGGKIGKKFLETDPFEIMLSRGMETNRRVEFLNFLNETRSRFGRTGEPVKKITRNPKTRKSTYKTEYPSFFIEEGTNKKLFGDEATEAIRAGKDGITYIDAKIPDLPDGTMLPDFLVEDIKKTHDSFMKEGTLNKLVEAYDSMMRLWKGSVYGWYPASHGRNFIGGAWNNFLANPKWTKFLGNAKDIVQSRDGSIVLNGKKYTYETLKKQIAQSGILGQTGYLDVNEINKAFNKSNWEKVRDLPLKASEAVENSLRIPLFLAEVDSGKSFKEAADSVFKYHFDYSPEGLTSIERNIFKRLIPFYTWNRKNIPLMIEEMIAQPAKSNSLFKSMKAITDEDGEVRLDLLPSYLDYIEKSFPISRGGQIITGAGLPPVEMLNFLQEPNRVIESGLTPAFKIPLELRMNYSTFKDKQISEDDYGEDFRNYPEELRNWLEWEDTSYEQKDGTKVSSSVVNPIKKYWLYALPTGRMLSTFKMLYNDDEANKITALITGIRTKDSSLEELKAQKDREYEKILLEILQSSSIYSKYGTPYKQSKEKLKNSK